MHHYLQISEVLRSICDQTSRGDLVSLARTCQAFRDPALDAVWHTLTSLVPLLRCLPPHIWEEHKRVLNIHPIAPDDCERIRQYNYRVKKFVIETADLDADFFRTLELSLPPGSFLLPNLCILSWTIEDDGLFPFCRLFLPPTLISVSVALQDRAQDLSLFSTLQISHPHLTDIHVDVPASSASVRTVSNAVSAWKFIQNLTVVTLDERALAHIARLPQLHDLNLLSYVPPVGLDLLSTRLPPRAFPALHHLDICSGTIQTAFSLVACISSVALEHLYITTAEFAPAHVWEATLAALPHLPARARLSSLSLCQRANANGTPSPPTTLDTGKYMLTPSSILPLLSLPALSHLALHPPSGVDLDDDAVRRLAAALPLLEVLELGGDEAFKAPRPRTTLLSLIHLAELCPHLHTLQISLDATAPIPHYTRARKSKPPYSLAYLHTPASPVNDPARVAAFLSGNFTSIGLVHRPEKEGERAWNEVARLFTAMREVRVAEARCWIAEDEDDGGWGSGEDDEESDDESVM